MDTVSRLNFYDITDTNHVRQELNLPGNYTNEELRRARKNSKWRVLIDFEGVVNDLGLFITEGEALKRYWAEYYKLRLLKESKKGFRD
ncbi:MAG: hypothetical protein IH949_10615, partial [Bacteroidetes bacterium]|nr:hypothetical protein [Bacteroidota bacterium]